MIDKKQKYFYLQKFLTKIIKNKQCGFFVSFFIFSLILLSPSVAKATIYDYKGIAFYAYDEISDGENLKPVYQFYNYSRKDWQYSISEARKNKAITDGNVSGYVYKGIAFYAYDEISDGENLKPVYQFYNYSRKDWQYSISEARKNKAITDGNVSGYVYKGIAFYAYDEISDGENLKPVYGAYSESNEDWQYFTSEERKDILINGSYGRNIKVGIKHYTPVELRENSFRIKANKDYVIKNSNGQIISKVDADTRTRVKYDSDGDLKIYDSIPETTLNEKIFFEAEDGNNLSMIFDVYQAQYRYETYYDNYRGKISLKYSNTYDNCVIRYGTSYCGTNRATGKKSSLIWVINEVSLEQYTWGMGEITGTGPMEYNKLMTTVYRTYGYWWYTHGTKYSDEGFDLRSTSGNQIYSGYDWETKYPRIKEAARLTRGKIIKYENEIAIIPYSSWTDGKTRSFKERWGSSSYPWCQSVSDPYGNYNGKYWDNSYKSTSQLVADGNHMVGISAHGALTLANDKNWNWGEILNYYIKNVKRINAY